MVTAAARTREKFGICRHISDTSAGRRQSQLPRTVAAHSRGRPARDQISEVAADLSLSNRSECNFIKWLKGSGVGASKKRKEASQTLNRMPAPPAQTTRLQTKQSGFCKISDSRQDCSVVLARLLPSSLLDLRPCLQIRTSPLRHLLL